MKLGVVGLPNVGKSTLFNALTRAGAPSANYPFCTIEPNVGIVSVPDERVDFLADHYKAKSVVNATIEFVDIAGLVKGAASGEGLGNKFLSHIREVDAIVHVVRTFANQDIIHVDGDVNPVRDINTISLELILSDIESVGKQIDKLSKQMKSQKADSKLGEELELLQKIKIALENEKFASTAMQTEKEREIARSFFLLTLKPVLYVANISENEINSFFSSTESDVAGSLRELIDFVHEQNNQIIGICAKIEEELGNEDDIEIRAELMQMYGMHQSGLDTLISASYKLLGLISYLTAGEAEVRAWTIPIGTKAPGAAGKIHTDFERGFIRAEIVAYDDFKKYGNIILAKENGKVRVEGKDYVVKDGDIIHFRFNV